MKKNAMLKIAAILLVAVLLTTCAISSTFAKYVLDPLASEDAARVAKWGVDVSADITAMFADTYKGGTGYTNVDTVANGDTDTATWDLVAPGTKGFVSLSTLITGTPEVTTSVKLAFDLEIAGDWTIDGDVYFPVVFYVKDAAGAKTYYGMGDFAWTDKSADDEATVSNSLANLEKAVEDAVNARLANGNTSGEIVYAPNENIGSKFTNLEIGWEWAFENGDNDANDTALGDLAADGTVNAITFSIDPEITQID